MGGWVGGGGGGIAIIVTSSRLQVTLRVEPCVELELNLIESDLEPSLLIELSGIKLVVTLGMVLLDTDVKEEI